MERQNENQLGNRISELRKEAGLTQEQLAGMLGVTYQAVSKWENGNSYPDISLLPRLSEIFHVSLDSLFGKEDNAILTEHVLEKAVKAATMEPSYKREIPKDAQQNRQTNEEKPGQDGDKEEREKRERKRESDPAQSFGEYIGNIVNMSLKSGINGLGKAMDTLKKIDFKNLDFKELDQAIGDKVKRAVEKGKKSYFFTNRGEGRDPEENVDEAVYGADEQGAGDQNEDDFLKENLFREMQQWGETKQLNIPWEDDGKIRVVVYLGRNMLSAKEYKNMKGRMTLEMEGTNRDIITYMNVSCENVSGNIQAGGDVSCDTVQGNVGAEGNISCDSVIGSVFAGGNVSCDNVEGNVVAGGNVECDTVYQNVTAGGTVECETIRGHVMAPHGSHKKE